MSSIPPAGATPVAPDATSGQTPVPPAAGAAAPTGDASTTYPDGLGDAGKAAIDRMKAERDEAIKAQKRTDKALADLQASHATDEEKAIAAARKEGAAEVLTRVQAQVRRSEVKAALVAAGLNGGLVDLASRADEFASLDVTEEGDVVGLAQAVDAFKRSQPSLFVAQPARPAGDAGLGPRGAPTTPGQNMNDIIRRATGRA